MGRETFKLAQVCPLCPFRLFSLARPPARARPPFSYKVYHTETNDRALMFLSIAIVATAIFLFRSCKIKPAEVPVRAPLPQTAPVPDFLPFVLVALRVCWRPSCFLFYRYFPRVAARMHMACLFVCESMLALASTRVCISWFASTARTGRPMTTHQSCVTGKTKRWVICRKLSDQNSSRLRVCTCARVCDVLRVGRLSVLLSADRARRPVPVSRLAGGGSCAAEAARSPSAQDPTLGARYLCRMQERVGWMRSHGECALFLEEGPTTVRCVLFGGGMEWVCIGTMSSPESATVLVPYLLIRSAPVKLYTGIQQVCIVACCLWS